MRQLHFVVNPKAGRGRALRASAEIVNAVRQEAQGRGELVHITQSYSGESFTWKSAGPVFERVLVCVGGDGSIHYNAQLAFRENVPLGIVPAGTGNDYANNLGLPMDALGIARTLLWGEATPVDAFTVNGNFVANIAGFGIDAAVVRFVDAHPVIKRLGRLGYSIAVPVSLARHKGFSVDLRLAGGKQISLPGVSMLAIAGGERFGGGMKIAPGADLQDGELDVIAAFGLSKLGLFQLFPKIYSGAHVADSRVFCYRTSRLDIHFPDLIPGAEYDGEPYTTNKTLSVQLVRGLRVLVPKKA